MQLSIIRVKRDSFTDGSISVYIRLHKSIADIFKLDPAGNVLEEMSSSNTWLDKNGEGVKKYNYIPQFSRVSATFNNFGANLMNNRGYNSINCSILRCVGIENGVTVRVNATYSTDEIKDYCTRLGETIKVIYTEYVKQVEVKTIVRI